MKAVIIAGGNISDYNILREECDKADKIICADSGIRHAKFINVIPDVWVGDFDSTDSMDYPAYEKVTLPLEKNDTDTHYAARIALYMGASDVVILGGIGTRLDHTMANISVLNFIEEKGVRAKLADEHNTVFVVKGDKTVTIPKTEGSYLSLIPFTPTVQVSASGVKYPLKNVTMYADTTLGISNEFVCPQAKITVKKGALIVFISKD